LGGTLCRTGKRSPIERKETLSKKTEAKKKKGSLKEGNSTEGERGVERSGWHFLCTGKGGRSMVFRRKSFLSSQRYPIWRRFLTRGGGRGQFHHQWGKENAAFPGNLFPKEKVKGRLKRGKTKEGEIYFLLKKRTSPHAKNEIQVKGIGTLFT